MDKISRRSFIAAGAAGTAALAVPNVMRAADQQRQQGAATGTAPVQIRFGDAQQRVVTGPLTREITGNVKGRPKLCLSTYSLQTFSQSPEGIEGCILAAADMGVSAIDILHRSLPTEDNDYCQKLKQLAYLNGITIACLSIHQGFVNPSPEVRISHENHTIRCLELAYNMGSPAIRLNSGSWGTRTGGYLTNNGFDTPLPGYTDEDGFKWIAESVKKCLRTAERTGVVMALENHWGLSRTADMMLRIKKDVDSNWVKFLVDTGNFLHEPYDDIAKILPETIFISCKTYQGGGRSYTLDLDYDRIFKMYHDVDFRGFITLEFEGNADPMESTIDSFQLFKKLIDKYWTNYPVK